MFKISVQVFLLLMIFNVIRAQDVNFSQFNTVAPYYNPAFTSTFTGNFRVSSIHRNQWIGLQERPISSFGVLGDIKFDLGFQDFKNDYFGAAVYFITDRAKIFDWNNNEISILLSYHKLLEKSSANYLSVGIGFGITQRSINYDNIYFEDQFDGITNYSGTSSELLPANIYSKPEIKFGLQHNTALNSKLRIQSGVALHYLFKPNLSLYNNFEDKDYTGSKTILANHKITGILNLIYNVNSYTDIYPRLLITNQGQHFMINTGLSFRRSFYTLNQTAFHSGVSTRLVKNLNSIVPADLGLQVGFEIKNFIIGLHYDFGIKDAIQYKSPTHSMEISFTLISNYDYEGYICPSF